MQLHWHRRNLRPYPNPALSTALDAAKRTDGHVASLFVLDDSVLSRANGLGVAFMLGSLHALRDWYRTHGSDLVIRHGDPTDVVCRTATEIGATRVVWNEDHSRLARERDDAVQRALTRSEIDYTAVPGAQLDGSSASSTVVAEPEAHLADPTALGLAPETVPRLADLGEDAFDPAPLTAGTEAARKRLQALSNGTTYRRCDDDTGRVAPIHRRLHTTA